MSSGNLPLDGRRWRLLRRGRVVADPARCIQCGTCTRNCPLGVDVRAAARRGGTVSHAGCLFCGSCVSRCPRGALRFIDPLGRDAEALP